MEVNQPIPPGYPQQIHPQGINDVETDINESLDKTLVYDEEGS
jgi:hypothetical protein